MAALVRPLTGMGEGRKANPEVGDLVTVLLVKDGGLVECGARLERVAYGTAFVKLVGLSVPVPYEIGQRFPLSMNKVIDW